MRPTTLVSLLIVGGVLAALPFRRSLPIAEPDPSSPSPLPLASRESPQSLSITESGWGSRNGFDPSLAWQPLPMVLPGHHAPELPKMPDSYYDVSFEIQQPRSVQSDRFPAAFAAGEPASSITAPQLPLQPQRTATLTREPDSISPTPTSSSFSAPPSSPFSPPLSDPAALAAAAPPAWTPQAAAERMSPGGTHIDRPLPEQASADDLINDRFVYAPLGRTLPSLATGPSEISEGYSTASQRSRATVEARRPAWAIDDPNRPRHYIREPD